MHRALDLDNVTEEYDFEEMCPHCDEPIAIVMDHAEFIRYKLVCPACGKKLMLCTLCQYDGSPVLCDWSEDRPCYRERFEDAVNNLGKHNLGGGKL